MQVSLVGKVKEIPRFLPILEMRILQPTCSEVYYSTISLRRCRVSNQCHVGLFLCLRDVQFFLHDEVLSFNKHPVIMLDVLNVFKRNKDFPLLYSDEMLIIIYRKIKIS